MPHTLYIAETDGSKSVATVWVKPRGKATARVFDPQKHIFDPAEDAQFTGAPEREIKRWLAAAVARRGARGDETRPAR